VSSAAIEDWERSIEYGIGRATYDRISQYSVGMLHARA
jgi:hypothetical protein